MHELITRSKELNMQYVIGRLHVTVSMPSLAK